MPLLGIEYCLDRGLPVLQFRDFVDYLLLLFEEHTRDLLLVDVAEKAGLKDILWSFEIREKKTPVFLGDVGIGKTSGVKQAFLRYVTEFLNNRDYILGLLRDAEGILGVSLSKEEEEEIVRKYVGREPVIWSSAPKPLKQEVISHPERYAVLITIPSISKTDDVGSTSVVWEKEDNAITPYTTFAPPDWIKIAEKEDSYTIVFWDEINFARLDVQKHIATMVLNRQFGTRSIPKTFFVGAGNPPIPEYPHASEFPIINRTRFSVFCVAPPTIGELGDYLLSIGVPPDLVLIAMNVLAEISASSSGERKGSAEWSWLIIKSNPMSPHLVPRTVTLALKSVASLMRSRILKTMGRKKKRSSLSLKSLLKSTLLSNVPPEFTNRFIEILEESLNEEKLMKIRKREEIMRVIQETRGFSELLRFVVGYMAFCIRKAVLEKEKKEEYLERANRMLNVLQELRSKKGSKDIFMKLDIVVPLLSSLFQAVKSRVEKGRVKIKKLF